MKMNTLQGIFDTRPKSKKNFIHENVKQLRKIQKPCINKDVNDNLPRKSNKFKHVAARVPAHVTHSMTSKQRDLSSSHELERTKNSEFPSRRSILSSLSAVRRSELQSINSDLGVQCKPMLVRKSQVCPAPSNRQESNVSEKTKKHGSTSSLNNASSAIKALSALSLSRSPTESPNLESEAVPRTLSEKSTPSERTVHNSLPVTNGHHPFLEKNVQSAFSEKCISRVLSENSVSLQPVRSVGCQTVVPEDSEGMFNEGVIKYPSSYILEPIRTESSLWMTRLPTRDSCQQTDTPPVKFPPLACERSKTYLNPIPIDEIMSYKSAVKKHHHVPQSSREQLSQRYESPIDTQNFNLLVQRNNNPKMDQAKDVLNGIQKQNVDINRKSLQSHEVFDSSYPLGHVPLSESERMETLRKLKKSYEDHIRQLNSLPVKTDTLKMRLRKIDIEKQLGKLEEGIKVFSRSKVFVKVGE